MPGRLHCPKNPIANNSAFFSFSSPSLRPLEPAAMDGGNASGDDAALVAGDESAASFPIQLLPLDVLHNILGRLTLRQALACRPVCRRFLDALSSPPFPSSLPSLRLLALRHPRAADSLHRFLHVFDSSERRWLRLPLSFLPFPSPSPVTASPSLLYLWVETAASSSAAAAAAKDHDKSDHDTSLVVCNPLTGSYRLLPPLGSVWSRHSTVLAGPNGAVVLVTKQIVLYYAPGQGHWGKDLLRFPSKPRSPIMMNGAVYALCDVGAPRRSQWKLYSWSLHDHQIRPLEQHGYSHGGDVFDIFKRPRLLPGAGGGRLLMIGGLRLPFVLEAPCSTVLILRLDLATKEWDEAGRMPLEMYSCFGGGVSSHVELAADGADGAAAAGGNNKVKVFGGDGKVWFSGKRVRGKLAMWEEKEVGNSGGGVWSWVVGIPGYPEGMYRGFVFDAGFTSTPRASHRR